MRLLSGWFADPDAKKPVTAHEALLMAQQALHVAGHRRGPFGDLCCIYTSVKEAGTPLQRDGRCRSWHVDFYLPVERTFYLVRIEDRKARGRERSLTAQPVEYLFAAYGSDEPQSGWPDAVTLPAKFLDTAEIVDMALGAAYRAIAPTLPDQRAWEEYHVMTIVLPAAYLRLRVPRPAAHPFTRGPAGLNYAVVVSPSDSESMVSALVFVDALGGGVKQCQAFRFPELIAPGIAADW